MVARSKRRRSSSDGRRREHVRQRSRPRPFLSVLFTGVTGPNGQVLKAKNLERCGNRSSPRRVSVLALEFSIDEVNGRRLIGH